MRKTFTPATENLTGFKSGATGASTTLTATSAGDSLAHQVGLTSTANLSGITMTVTGTDENGLALTEAIAGPNNNTVETTGYFLTVTDVSFSATLGASTMGIGWVDEFVTPTIGLNSWAFAASCQVKVTGTINYTLQETLSRLRDITATSLYWTDVVDPAALIDVTDITASSKWVFAPPPRAVRLKANSYSAGAVLVFYWQNQIPAN